MATIYIKGAPIVFTVTGAGAPAIGGTYTNNGGTYTIIATSLVAGAGTITCTIPTNTAPLLSASLVAVTGGGTTVTSGNWSYTCASDTHIKEIPASYANGDAIEVSNAINGFVRLIIDGEDAADVAAIETEKPLSTICAVTGEILLTNASTTHPLIFPLSATSSSNFLRATGYAATLKSRGSRIEVYTSNGTRGQSFNLNFPTLNGMQIDNPPVLYAEADDGAGEYITTTPTAGATYTNNGSTFTVVSASVTAGEGEMVCTRTSGTNEPQEIGILTKATGTGDAVIGFRLVNLEGTTRYRFTVGYAWIPLGNIGGAYANKANTAYTAGAFATLSEFGRTPSLGNVFEYDEYNGGAGYGKVYLGKDNLYAFGTGLTCTTLPAVGDTYTNNGATFTIIHVMDSGSGSTKGRMLWCSGTGAPTTSGTLTRTAGAGDASIVFIDSGATGGWVPPNGAKITMPSIHITTAGVAGTTANLRATVGSNTYQHSNFDLENTSLSDRITLGGSSWGFFANFRARHFAQFGIAYGSATVATEDYDVDGLYQAVDKWIAGSNVQAIPDAQGTLSVDRVYTWCNGNQATPFGFQVNTANITKIGEMHCTVTRRITTSYYSVRINELRVPANSPLTVGPIFAVGHRFAVTDSRNVRAYDIRHSDTASGVMSGLWAVNVGNVADQSENVIVEKVRRLPSGASNYTTMFVTDSGNVQTAIHDVVYDCLATSGAANKAPVHFISGGDTRTWATNATLTNSTGVLWGGANVNKAPVRLHNVFSDYATSVTSDTKGGVELNLVGVNTPSIAFSYTIDNAHFSTTYSGGTRDVGKLTYAPGSKSSAASGIFSAVTGTEGADYSFVGATVLQCPGIIELTSNTVRPLRGIRASAAAFTSATLAVTAASGTGLTYSARLCKWGDDITAVSFVDVTSQANARTNFQAMLDTAITAGYTPEIGLQLQMKVIGTAAQVGRTFSSYILSAVQMATTFTPPEVGFIEIEYTGATSGASVALVDDSVVTHYTSSTTGSETYEVPYDFTGTADDMRISKPKVFKLVARKAGYAESILDAQECYQAGTSLPMALALDYATTDADIDAAHLALNGTAKTFTITASHTMLELYQRAQWWAHQEANMNYDTPLTTKSGTTFTQPSTWTITGIENITGGGTVSQGTVNLNGPATYGIGFNGATIVAQGEGTYGLTATSSIITFAPTTSGVTYSLGTGSFSGEIDLRNTHATRTITVQLPAGTSYTDANNTGGAITVTTPTVERGLEFTPLIAGSFVKVFNTGATTELFSTLSSSTTETWDDATSGSLTVDYVIMKAGYKPIKVVGVTVTGAVGTGIQTIGVDQEVDPLYDASTGLTWAEISIDTTNKYVKLNDLSTVKNFYSFLIEQWIDRGGVGATGAELANVKFPIELNGLGGFSLIDGWETRGFTVAGTGIANTTLTNLTRDGLSYLDVSGVQTSIWTAILTSGVQSGARVRYQQSDAGTTVNALASSGEMDELVHVYGDASHGNFDKRGYLVLKVQEMGYDQAEANVVTLYGNLEDRMLVVGLSPISNGLTVGDPGLATAPTITQGTYTLDGQTYSVKIVDGATPNSGTDIMRWLRYNFETGGAFQSEDAFNWHDLVKTNGSAFKTVRGTVYGTATTNGVVVYQNDGTTLHPDFTLFTADNGTTYAPPVFSNISITGMPTAAAATTRLQIINQTAEGASAWAANTVYATGAIVKRTTGLGSESTAGLYFRATTGGTSHATTEPTWDTTVGNTTADNTVVWTCYSILFYHADPVTATLSDTYIDGEEFLAGETVEIRFAEMDQATTFKIFDTTTIVSSSGFTIGVSVEEIPEYATFAIDGSTQDGTFSPNFVDDYITMDANIDFLGKGAFAYYCYILTTDQGMYEFWNGVTALDAGNIRIESDILNLFFDESAGFVKQTDDVRIFRKDGLRPVIDPTTGGSGVEINWRTPVSVITTSDQAVNLETVQAGLTAQGYTTTRASKIDDIDENADMAAIK